ncbi:DUF1800 domain-containing protein [Achromobacter sp. RTa]|uniref:DUF1800 domain-containing protein n=1 Tax=Achromobacter sp. RTa TaxID=1532557 RepID=UPI00068A668A|nr:DUF1800 domain-containing protein [Achromobacter sp. RTa]
MLPAHLRRVLPLLLLPLAACALAQADVDAKTREAALVNRVTWGATPAELARMQQVGAERYLHAQLHPVSQDKLPAAVQQRIDALSISRTSDEAARATQISMRQKANKLPPDEKIKAMREARRFSIRRAAEVNDRALWRALYSANQLQDQMTWFWMNHFNVDLNKGDVGVFLSQYEDRAIRPHALGKFRDLLSATMRAPAMLIYLDNTQNAAGKINENYARELMELHTLGVGGGYSQTDVQELARILTGLGISNKPEPPKVKREWRDKVVQEGLFLFNPARHDFGEKKFLGHRIAGTGMQEVDKAAELLARNPATAKHVSGKLAVYFMGDAPPASVVDKMARTFLASDGDIAATLKTLFDSPEFSASLKKGIFKDPVHYVYSSLRLAYGGMPPILNPKMGVGMLKQLGQPLNQRLTPDGYPMSKSDWAGSGQMTTRFEVASVIAGAPQRFYKVGGDDPTDLPPLPDLLKANAGNGLFAGLSSATREAIEQAKSRSKANTYLLASPEFMLR